MAQLIKENWISHLLLGSVVLFCAVYQICLIVLIELRWWPLLRVLPSFWPPLLAGLWKFSALIACHVKKVVI